MRIMSIILHDSHASPAAVPIILNHLGLPVDLPTLAPARHTGRGPHEEESEATFRPHDGRYVDDAPTADDYCSDGPGWEEPALAVEE